MYSVSKGKFVWLGGSRHTHTGFWSWTDGSTWSFTQWAHGHPHKEVNFDLVSSSLTFETADEGGSFKDQTVQVSNHPKVGMLNI